MLCSIKNLIFFYLTLLLYCSGFFVYLPSMLLDAQYLLSLSLEYLWHHLLFPGGLFVCLSKENAIKFCEELQELDGRPAWIIGDVVKGLKTAEISEDYKILEV